MQVERFDTGVTAAFDAAEASAVSRSADAIPGWMQERPVAARGTLKAARDGAVALRATFADEAALAAFLDRFLPGKARGGLARA